MNLIDQYGFNEHNGGQGQQVLLYKLWPLDSRPPRLWYFASITKGPRGKLVDRLIWTDELSEATPLPHTTAWDYAKTLTTNYTANDGQSCAVGVMPYHPATVPDKG